MKIEALHMAEASGRRTHILLDREREVLEDYSERGSVFIARVSPQGFTPPIRVYRCSSAANNEIHSKPLNPNPLQKQTPKLTHPQKPVRNYFQKPFTENKPLNPISPKNLHNHP
jgi:hypothetical protein